MKNEFNDNIDCSKREKEADLLLKNGKVVNFFSEQLEDYDVLINNGKIVGLGKYDSAKKVIDLNGKIVTAGFMDSHIHLESSIISPKNFASLALMHGTTSVLTDPHEITNVLGSEGIDFMLESTKDLLMDVFFMLPSCVPATNICDNYKAFTYEDMKKYMDNPRILGLAEMMNYVGVINKDSEIYEKLSHFNIIDGHAPSLSGDDLNAYILAGIETDHECSSIEEALEKLKKGLYINIREGSGAHNLKALAPLIKMPYAMRLMFATDDKHPEEILKDGLIDYDIKMAISYGANPITCLMMASYIPSIYLNLRDRGFVGIGKKADIVILDNLADINVLYTIKDGKIVYDGNSLIDDKFIPYNIKNTMETSLKTKEDFTFTTKDIGIEIIPGELLTKKFVPNQESDLCMVAVFERYHYTNNHAMCYAKGYNLKSGAIATSVAHDSHNIIVIGTNVDDMVLAVNTIIQSGGGMVVCNNGQVLSSLSLDIAGLMTSLPVMEVIDKINELKKQAYLMGVPEGIDPFMNLSFLSLPVIPEIKITSRGIVDVIKNEIIK